MTFETFGDCPRCARGRRSQPTRGVIVGRWLTTALIAALGIGGAAAMIWPERLVDYLRSLPW